jgi:hypothetical protein
MSDPTLIDVRGFDGRVFDHLPILRTITLRGIPGFCIHRYVTEDGIEEYRVSHIETGGYLTRGLTDGEAFTATRKFSKEEIEHKIIRARRELDRLQELRDRHKEQEK